MNFFVLILVVWGTALGAWYLISNYVKKSDLQEIKSRLTGATKAKKSNKIKKGKPAKPLLQELRDHKNQIAQILVDRSHLGPNLTIFLEQAGLRWSAARLVNSCLISFGAGAVVSLVLLPIPTMLAILFGLGASGFPLLYVAVCRRRRLSAFEAIFPDTLGFIARSMRAGHAFQVSIEMIQREFQEPVAGEFRRTFEEHNLGLPLDVALAKLGQRVPSLDVHFFVSAVMLQKRTGGNLAEILDKLAYVIRERFKLRGRIKAVSAHGRMTATALSAIPIVVGVLMLWLNKEYFEFFMTDPVGQLMLGACVALQLTGFAVMKHLVKIEI